MSRYLSPLAAIITAEGDVIKFAGDALLAFWSCSKFEAVQKVNHVLTKCLKMQRDYDNYQTVGGSILRMKLGISVGNLDMYHIGETCVLGPCAVDKDLRFETSCMIFRIIATRFALKQF